jgi:putative SOS response-associated peptidase YedK
MCGRYRLSRRKQVIEEHFDAVSGEEDWSPRYNIAPTQPVPIIRQNPKEPRRELSLVRWGLVPAWAKDASGAAMMINARSEQPTISPHFVML